MPPTGYIASRTNYDYSVRDQAFFLNTWAKLDVTEESTGEFTDDKDRNQENYFDTGLSLDRVMSSCKGTVKSGGPQKETVMPKSGKRPAPSQTPTAGATNVVLPKFGLVEVLQRAFHIPDLLSENPFLNQEAATKMFKRKKINKRVRFAKVEITEKHLPNCRRNNFTKHEFGHFHSPSCSNYKAEQSLGKQEFLIRGNFIRENSKTATSECDFYKEPVRYVEPLDPALTTPTLAPSCDLLRLDLKTSSMDSITYHDKSSPGLRYTQNPVEKTEKEKPAQSSSVSSFAPNPNYKPMPCQPIFTDDVIISPPSRSKVVVDTKSEITLPKSKRHSNLPEPRVPEISVIPAGPASPGVCDMVDSCDDLKLLPEPADKSRIGSDSGSVDSVSSSLDSGYDSKCGDFLDDFLHDMSDDSESESEDTDEMVSGNSAFSAFPNKDLSESDSDTVIDGPPSSNGSTSLPIIDSESSSSESDIDEVEPDALLDHQHDSGIGSLSDNEEDIDDLIKSRPSIRSAKPALINPNKWSSHSVQPVTVSVKKENNPRQQQTFQMREGYMNPFSNRSTASSVLLKPAPSVLGRLICEIRPVTLDLIRNPDVDPERFLFNTPSPDDVVRIRQSGKVSC